MLVKAALSKALSNFPELKTGGRVYETLEGVSNLAYAWVYSRSPDPSFGEDVFKQGLASPDFATKWNEVFDRCYPGLQFQPNSAGVFRAFTHCFNPKGLDQIEAARKLADMSLYTYTYRPSELAARRRDLGELVDSIRKSQA